VSAAASATVTRPSHRESHLASSSHHFVVVNDLSWLFFFPNTYTYFYFGRCTPITQKTTHLCGVCCDSHHHTHKTSLPATRRHGQKKCSYHQQRLFPPFFLSDCLRPVPLIRNTEFFVFTFAELLFLSPTSTHTCVCTRIPPFFLSFRLERCAEYLV
jgi:hypothetical protein